MNHPSDTNPTDAGGAATTCERRAPRTVAVVGSGVSGLIAAHTLSATHQVTLYEADDRLGGHAHTHLVPGAKGEDPLPVDSGFIVLNDRTYPTLNRVFTQLAVAITPTEMSMSVRDEASGLEYAGGKGLPGFVARPRQLVQSSYLGMLASVARFHRLGAQFLATTTDDDATTYGELLHEGRFSATFLRWYAIPLVACVWSTGTDEVLQYPARYLLRFLDHHGMLSVGNSPQWYTVKGGSATYVQAIAQRLHEVRTSSPVRSVADVDAGMEVTTASDVSHYDAVVIATHPDQALRLLAHPTEEQRRVLGAFRYSRNVATLHRDLSVLPRAAGARASWNYLVRGEGTAPMVTYWMNRLQHLPASHPALVTLNGQERLDASLVIRSMTYEHPIYTPESVRAQRSLPLLSTPRLAFAGAYHGWGFHEDGARSGQAAAESIMAAATAGETR